MTLPAIAGISPFFIVKDVAAAFAFYCDRLGFEVIYRVPGDDLFFGIVRRDRAMILLKAVEAPPLPNCERDPAARWDAYVDVPDPDALAAEYASRGVRFSVPLEDTHDGLRGFELKDVDGHVLFFGRPSRSPKRAASDFDAAAMHAAMDAQRLDRGLSWPQVAREIWKQSAALNSRRKDHPISPATLTGIARRGDCTCQHALFILRWLGRSPESFVDGADVALPPAGEDRRLRWNLAAVYEAMDARRRQLGLTWRELARVLRCTDHQLTGLRRARYAIGMKLMMRIVQWLERPSSAFIHAARW